MRPNATVHTQSRAYEYYPLVRPCYIHNRVRMNTPLVVSDPVVLEGVDGNIHTNWLGTYIALKKPSRRDLSALVCGGHGGGVCRFVRSSTKYRIQPYHGFVIVLHTCSYLRRALLL